MNSKNSLEVEWGNGNPDLKDLFSQKKAGDKLTLEIDIVITDITDTGITASIKKVTSDEEDAEDVQPEIDGEKPFSMAMNMGKGGVGGSEGKDAEDMAEA